MVFPSKERKGSEVHGKESAFLSEWGGSGRKREEIGRGGV